MPIIVGDNGKLETILKTMEYHRNAIESRRELQFKTFTWISSFYGIVLAGIVTIMSRNVHNNIPIFVPFLISLGSLCIAIPCIKFLKQCRASMNRNARNIVPIEEMLGLFSPGFYTEGVTLYSEKSKDWGNPLCCRTGHNVKHISAWKELVTYIGAFIEKCITNFKKCKANPQRHSDCTNCHFLFAVPACCASPETSFFIIAIGMLCFCVVSLSFYSL